jgi:transposase-like protein
VPAGLRRAQGPAGRGQRGVGEDDRANLYRASSAEFLQVRLERDWAQIAKDLKPVYTAASESEALDRFAEFSGKWEKRYPAIIRLWENAWAEFVPFLRFDREIRTVICTTNAIESINARLGRAVNTRGHFPTEQAAMKCLYLAIMSLDPTGRAASAGRTGGRPP